MTAGASEPEVAVVIPTRDRETRLRFALESLAEQTVAPERFEVVVVRAVDSPSPFADPPPGLVVRFLTHGGTPGAAAQRNLGWRSSAAGLVAFIDDDSRPASRWLEELLAAHGGESTFVQGRIEPDPSEHHLLFGLARSHEIVGPSPRHESGNIAYPRSLLERLGGFDEAFTGAAWGEDTDLGLRARRAGARPLYADRALVWHAVLPRRLPDALRDATRYESLIALLARHPEHRRALFPTGVVKESHATLPLALVGMTQLRRRPALAAAASAPYLARHLRRHLGVNRPTARTLARFLVHLPAVVALDAAEVAVTVRAAIRHRVPVI
jgi:GT2 family glycosyltransferase